MPELRRDPIIGRWVIIATERAKRPRDFRTDKPGTRKGFCPFCKGFEDKTPPEILAYRSKDSRPNTPGWRVRVVPNKFPALRIEGGLGKHGEGIYDIMNGIGAHEVIIESPEHIISNTELSHEHMIEVLWSYRDRLIDLKKDPRFVYGLIFKNVGLAAGASLEHAHTQLIVMPIVPRTVHAEMEGGQRFHNYRGRCIFCDMIIQEASDRKRVVMETEHYLAFAPFAARFPFETWIVPKRHCSCFENIQKVEIEDLADTLKRTLTKIESALEMPPYNYIIHTSPFDRGELPYYHWHIEIIPRLTKVAGFEWGTGFYINPIPPEDAAEFLGEMEA
ncbi:MAG: galactose-1-phosphate uridylyltransferase [Planctomycetota bacterium]|jgi:UDPglucose--hexose-1-phosphate uridylyltransferase